MPQSCRIMAMQHSCNSTIRPAMPVIRPWSMSVAFARRQKGRGARQRNSFAVLRFCYCYGYFLRVLLLYSLLSLSSFSVMFSSYAYFFSFPNEFVAVFMIVCYSWALLLLFFVLLLYLLLLLSLLVIYSAFFYEFVEVFMITKSNLLLIILTSLLLHTRPHQYFAL